MLSLQDRSRFLCVFYMFGSVLFGQNNKTLHTAWQVYFSSQYVQSKNQTFWRVRIYVPWNVASVCTCFTKLILYVKEEVIFTFSPFCQLTFKTLAWKRNNFLFLLSFRLLSEFTFGWKDGGKKEEELWPVFCTFVQLQQQVLIQKGKKGAKIWRNKTQWFIFRFKIKVF